MRAYNEYSKIQYIYSVILREVEALVCVHCKVSQPGLRESYEKSAKSI
jgi:hypothetical protein